MRLGSGALPSSRVPSMRAPAGEGSSQLFPLIPSAFPSTGVQRSLSEQERARKPRSLPVVTGINGFSVVPCQCVLGPWGSNKKNVTPPIFEQVQVCLIASFSTLPNCSLLPGPFVLSPPHFSSNSGHAKPFSSSVHVCRGSFHQGELGRSSGASFAGALFP